MKENLMKKKKIVAGAISLAILIPILLYGTGIIAQFIININAWKAAGSNYRESPGLPSLEIGDVLSAVFTFPEGLIAVGAVIAGVALLCMPNSATALFLRSNSVFRWGTIIRDSERRTNHCSLSIERRMKKNRVVIRCADTNFWAVFPPQI